MNYYKFKSTNPEDLRTITDSALAYLLHPNFVFAFDCDLSQLKYATPIGVGPVTIRTCDLIAIHKPATAIVKYLMRDGSDLTIDLMQESIDGNYTYKGRNMLHTVQSLPIIPTDKVIKDESAITWSEPREVTTSLLDYIRKQIRNRYAYIPIPRNIRSIPNLVLDSYLPNTMDSNNFNNVQSGLHSYTRKAYAISPMTASFFDVPQIPVLDLCKTLGYTEQQLKTMTQEIRGKRLRHLVLAGAGGTNVNTMHWIASIAKELDCGKLFNSILIHEEDVPDVSNLLRFPKNPKSQEVVSDNKANILLKDCEYLSDKGVRIVDKFIGTSGNFPREYMDRSNSQTTFSSHYVVYGAPTIESRANLSKFGNFVCATHAANGCSIWLNPSQDLDLQVESYGTIQLMPFFMNQLKMAITFLEMLAANTDFSTKDTHIMDYEFDTTKDDYVFHVHKEAVSPLLEGQTPDILGDTI